jgi:hypothetical protein
MFSRNEGARKGGSGDFAFFHPSQSRLRSKADECRERKQDEVDVMEQT